MIACYILSQIQDFLTISKSALKLLLDGSLIYAPLLEKKIFESYVCIGGLKYTIVCYWRMDLPTSKIKNTIFRDSDFPGCQLSTALIKCCITPIATINTH